MFEGAVVIAGAHAAFGDPIELYRSIVADWSVSKTCPLGSISMLPT